MLMVKVYYLCKPSNSLTTSGRITQPVDMPCYEQIRSLLTSFFYLCFIFSLCLNIACNFRSLSSYIGTCKIPKLITVVLVVKELNIY